MNNNTNNFLNDINLKNGKITYNDFKINPTIPFELQKWSFKEDLLQIQFNNNQLIDIGWYPEFKRNGFFAIRLIKNFDWENSIFEKKCKDLSLLKRYLQEAIDIAADIDKDHL